jgi:hypothetical protein
MPARNAIATIAAPANCACNGCAAYTGGKALLVARIDALLARLMFKQ